LQRQQFPGRSYNNKSLCNDHLGNSAVPATNSDIAGCISVESFNKGVPRMTNQNPNMPNQNPGQQNQNPGQKPGQQQQGGGQKPGQQQQDPNRQDQAPGQKPDR
jgi:hypothetical protein